MWIVWNRTFYLYKNKFYIKLPTKVYQPWKPKQTKPNQTEPIKVLYHVTSAVITLFICHLSLKVSEIEKSSERILFKSKSR